MPYVGKSPIGGGFHKLDNLTASATATYALTLGGAAYYPETANQLLVSLNGLIQACQDSFTVSGSNLIFDSALTSSDSIDFVVALGDVLGVQGVTDGAVTTNKIGNGAVTKAKIGTTELDLATIKDSTGTTTAMTIDSSGRILTPARPAFHFRRNAAMGSSGEITYTHTEFNIGNHAVQNTGVFTAPIDGIYQFSFQCIGTQTSTSADVYAKINGAIVASRWSIRPTSVNANQTYSSMPASTILLQLSANDTLVMNTTVALYSDPNSWIRFSGHLVG